MSRTSIRPHPPTNPPAKKIQLSATLSPLHQTHLTPLWNSTQGNRSPGAESGVFNHRWKRRNLSDCCSGLISHIQGLYYTKYSAGVSANICCWEELQCDVMFICNFLWFLATDTKRRVCVCETESERERQRERRAFVRHSRKLNHLSPESHRSLLSTLPPSCDIHITPCHTGKPASPHACTLSSELK